MAVAVVTAEAVAGVEAAEAVAEAVAEIEESLAEVIAVAAVAAMARAAVPVDGHWLKQDFDDQTGRRSMA